MSEEATTTANAGDSPNQSEAQGQTFSQEDVDRIVNERLARERKKFEGFDDIKAKAEKFDAVTSERDALAATSGASRRRAGPITSFSSTSPRASTHRQAAPPSSSRTASCSAVRRQDCVKPW